MKSKNKYVFDLKAIDKTLLPLVGGKGANLGELSRIEGIKVPAGFCVSTEILKKIMEETPELPDLLHQLAELEVKNQKKITELSRKIRRVIGQVPIPADLQEEIHYHLKKFGENAAYAVRSSATAEDLPTASFAGQQNTYLNVIGLEAILKHISQCWASLFTERAIIYRRQNGFDEGKVYLAVVVQKMVFPKAAGIVFTADPVSGNRKITSIDASFGLGDAVVSGLVNADNYQVQNGQITEKKIAIKKRAVFAQKTGGTIAQDLAPDQQTEQTLADDQILKLAQIGRKIEAHFNYPQDIEWCLAKDTFYLVQSRPITTLYPIPEANDPEKHVYVSVGHQQMMTDAFKPLGLSVWQLIAFRPMFKAGGRLFVDVTQQLASLETREALLQAMGQHDPLIKDALTTILGRGNFIKDLSCPEQAAGNSQNKMPSPAETETDPAIVAELVQQRYTELEAVKQNMRQKSGAELLHFILEDIPQLKKSISAPLNFGVISLAMNACWWINEKMQEWLGEKNVADTLSQSVPHNITSEMGLALLDVADAIRPYPEVVAYLHQVNDEDFLNNLQKCPGGPEARTAINAFLDKYGMRGAGEIDITRPRWSEKPIILIPIILHHVKNFAPGASKRKWEEGQKAAREKEKELLNRLKQLPDGDLKVKETKRMIDLIRNFIGYREFPKYYIVSRLFLYKQALLKVAEQLVQQGIIPEKEAIYYLTFDELSECVRTRQFDYQLIQKRSNDYQFFKKLTPPRVITSDGEIVTGTYNREKIPAEALVGLAVSAGVVEGCARVFLKMEEAELEPGDILVTVFTDPSWTPLFVSIAGLITEVGGLMTHGAVIAREYGLPAVVGVENATKLIQDGQRIRVHGTEGYVEMI